MGNLSALIVDKNRIHVDIFRTYLHKTGLFTQIYTAADGIEALDIIRQERPELVLTALVLERFDGMVLVETIAKTYKSHRPKLIIASSLTYPDIVDLGLSKGADLYFAKSIDLDLFIKKVRELMLSPVCIQPRHSAIYSDREMLQRITKEIQLIGLPSSSMGYKYVRHAIKLVLEDDTMLENVMTRLYPMVAEKFNTNTACVERNIRHAIESAWMHGSMSYIDKVFGYSIDADKGKPTNRAFIATIVDRIRLHLHYF